MKISKRNKGSGQGTIRHPAKLHPKEKEKNWMTLKIHAIHQLFKDYCNKDCPFFVSPTPAKKEEKQWDCHFGVSHEVGCPHVGEPVGEEVKK